MTNNQPPWRVLLGSRSFGQAAPAHITQLEEAGCEVIRNEDGRAYKAEQLLDALQDVDAIITGTDELTAEVIHSANRLQTIAKHGVGLDNIDIDAATARGISVTATPGVIHDSVADMTLALLLALARKLIPAHATVTSGGWRGYTGFELGGKTLGIIGLGRIGKAVCRRAQAFGMSVIAMDPYPDRDFAAKHGVDFVALDDLLVRSDTVSLHAAASDDGPLLGARELGQMKPGAYLLNTARGALVDEIALAAALRDGRLAGAGLDVLVDEPPADDHPLLKLAATHPDQLVLTPHISGRTTDGLIRMGQMTVDNCLAALRGERPAYQVNTT